MKKTIISFIAVFSMCAPAVALTPTAGRGRQMATNKIMSAPRAVASGAQSNNIAAPVMTSANVPVSNATNTVATVPGPVAVTANAVPAAVAVNVSKPIAAEKDMRETEKAACTMNNIGVGNTFVWASRYSNLNTYSSMVEDIDVPENNTCFVRVEMRSDDPRISVSDVPVKYFEWGRTITCGSWADEKALEKRILDAKKTGRTWATVGGAVGGAAIGVGAMELFGNGLIGGKVEGQNALKGNDLYASQIKVLKKNNDTSTLPKIREHLSNLKEYCDSEVWLDDDGKNQMPDNIKNLCSREKYDYERLLGIINQ